jgi:Na+-driven multidrug efflux pump
MGNLDPPMTLRSATKTLLVLVLALPVAQIVLIWVRGLLKSMGDAEGSAIIGHVGTVCQVVWAVCLVALVIVSSLIVLNGRPPKEQE